MGYCHPYKSQALVKTSSNKVLEVSALRCPFGRGLVACIPGIIAINIVEYILKLMQISETPLPQAGAIFFLTEEAARTPLGIAIGFFAHIFVAVLAGILISYYIYYSGTDYAVIKGIVISMLFLFITLGIVFPLRDLAVEMQGSPNDVLAAIIDHTVFGALVGWTIKYLQEKQAVLR